VSETRTCCSVCYGKEMREVFIPTKNLIGLISVKPQAGAADEPAILRAALNNPIASRRLCQLAKPGMKVAIIADDITRPTPTAKMLPLVMEELRAAGVAEKDITLVFAMGSHRPHTRREQQLLLGGEWIERIRVIDHNAFDKSALVSLGKTSRGTPIEINRQVAEADLRVMLGLIKPHCTAGYTGGGKAILPGVSGIETIIADHCYETTAHPCSIIGVIDGNPVRADIEDAAGVLSPSFVFNVILDRDKRVAAAVSGDMIKAHRRGAALADELIRADVHEVCDIAVVGCRYPASIHLYIAANAALSCVRVPRPIIRRGGVLIMAAPCEEGIGGGPFHELMRDADSPEDVLDKISQPGFFVHDQWAAQLWADALTHCDVYLVADGLSEQDARDMKCRLFSSLDAALDAAFERMGRDARVTAITDGPNCIVSLV
jgi:nickel-dependent lactate racemase